jgi:hypothetical protein
MRKQLYLSIVLLLSTALVVTAQEIDILSGIKIKLRDGIQLNATIYKPHDQKEALPVILQLTPYISDTYHSRGSYFAKNGYVYAIVDARGRGSSEGVFDPFMQEAKDGYDVIEWLATQQYCNGKVTMWGGSYSGYNQWATAKEFPPHLKTIVPVASVKPGVDFPMLHNVSYHYIMQWLMYTNEKTGNASLFGDNDFWKSKFTQRYKQDLAFNYLDTLVGRPSATFQLWVKHPYYDSYFKSMSPTPTQYANLTIPILSITGHYDADQVGALTFYREHIRFGNADAKEKHFLIIGPWDHAGTRTPRKEVGGLTFGDSSVIDINGLHKQWYDYTLKDGTKPSFLKNKVAYFISNRNKWKYTTSLDDIGKDKLSFCLNNYTLQTLDVVHSGALEPIIAKKNLPALYTYDPLDKSSGLFDEGVPDNTTTWLTDQRMAYRLGKAGAIYHTEPFEKEVEVSGFFELKVWLETDVKDIDIEADVFEIKSDGSVVFLTSQTIRSRHKDDLEKEKLLTPGEVNQFHFNNFTFISRVIEKGSRLRLIITSPNSIYTQKNYCSGGIVATETAKDARTAHVKIHNDNNRQSLLLVPVVRE